MKWRNHMLVAGSIAAILGFSPAEIAYCAACSNLPDQLERIGKHQIIKHRTLTHDILFWLVPLVALEVLSRSPGLVSSIFSLSLGTPDGSHFAIRSFVLFLPGLLHLAGDIMTPKGVRVAGRSISLRLFPTGHPLEYIVAGFFVILAVIFKSGGDISSALHFLK